MPTTLTTSVEDKLAKLIDKIAQEEGMDRSTVIRRFLINSTTEWLIEKYLKKYEEGKITLWQAAEKCELSLWEMIAEVKKRRIKVPYTIEELQEDMKGLG
ncbi:MAG: ribbon-helix-helix protein, CopG family [Candidatus Lokiarchaeota archaeon]|nr:ribbon-helix-helix protein, CopG family [Candidatus Lokiarchaeota archaeon]